MFEASRSKRMKTTENWTGLMPTESAMGTPGNNIALAAKTAVAFRNDEFFATSKGNFSVVVVY